MTTEPTSDTQEQGTQIPEEPKTVIGPRGNPLLLKGLLLKRLVLGVEKFDRPDKHYRLIWMFGQGAWKAEEDKTPYRRKFGEGSAVEAGQKLAQELGVKFSDAPR